MMVAEPVEGTQKLINQLLVRRETLLGEGLVLGARTAVVGVRIDGDAAARGEEAGDLYVFGIHQLDEILHNLVDAILVEVSVVAETEQIQLQALALDHPHVRNITDPDLGEVRLPRDRTQARELRAVEPHPVIVALMLVDECLQNLRSIVTFIFSLLSEGLKALQFSSFCHNMQLTILLKNLTSRQRRPYYIHQSGNMPMNIPESDGINYISLTLNGL